MANHKNPNPNPNTTTTSSPFIDPTSGFCSKTSTFHSLRPPSPLPPLSTPLSLTDFIFSLLSSRPPPPLAPALIDAATSRHIPHQDLRVRVESLSSSLRSRFALSKGDRALILSPNTIHIPILYFSLLSLGVVVSPSNPAATSPEILHLVKISNPVIAFAPSKIAAKIPVLPLGTVLLDSPEFESLITAAEARLSPELEMEIVKPNVSQSDTAAILYSSGTTGTVKGVELTHRNLISVVAGALAVRQARESAAVFLCTVSFYHVYGFGLLVRTLGTGESLVCAERFDVRVLGRVIEEFRVSHVAMAPTAVIWMVKNRSVMDGCDLSSLEVVASGGAPLRKDFVLTFREAFPNVQLAQAYGLTESTGRIFGTFGTKEASVTGATGRLLSGCQAKIVHPETGTALPPNNIGELWVKGPLIMKGYVGDEEATRSVMDSEGWLRTGDICYIDHNGYLFYVDRIKEIIKYKGYQVAPAELEQLLQSHPDVEEVVVAPYPDEEVGQIPMAFVVRRPGSTIGESEIKAFVAKLVAPYKKVRRVMFIDTIPKNAAGKVLRRELTKLAMLSASSKL